MFSPKPAILLLLSSVFSFGFLQAQQPKLVLPIGHTEAIRSVTFSPNGKRIITGSRDNTVKLWDAFSGLLLADMKDHKGPVISTAFSPDGTKIITGAADGTAIIWSAATAKPLRVLKTGFEDVTFLQFSIDGKRVLLCADNGSLETFDDLEFLGKEGMHYIPAYSNISIWDVSSGKKICELQGASFNLFAPQFSPGNSRVLSPAPDSSAIVWDAHTGKKLLVLKGHTALVMNARFSSDEKKIVTASWDKTACVWDAISGKILTKLTGHTDKVMSAAFSHNDKMIATSSFDGSINTWETETGKLLTSIKSDSELFYNAVFSYDDKKLIITSFNGFINIWDIDNGKLLAEEPNGFLPDDLSSSTINIPALSQDNRRIASFTASTDVNIWNLLTGEILVRLKGYSKEFHTAEYSPDGKKIVTACFDSTAKIWDADGAHLLTTLKKHNGLVFDASYSPDGKKIVTASDDSSCIIWDAETGDKKSILKGHGARVNSARFSFDGKKIVTASYDGTGIIWDSETGARDKILAGHTEYVQRAVFSPDGKRIATASDDGLVLIWDAQTGEIADTLSLDVYVNSAVYSPDGKKLVITKALDDMSVVSVWNIVSGKKIFELKGNDGSSYQKGEIRFAGFNGDGKLIITASADHTARIWDAFTGKLLHTLKGHKLNVTSATFSPDSKKVITTSWDRTLKIWNARNGKLISTLIAIGENDYLFQLPSGYYKSTPNAAKYLYYVTKDLKVITFEQLDVKYNRPDIVLEAIGNTDTALIKSYRKAWEKRIKKLGIDTTTFRDDYSIPEADFVNRDSITDEQTNENLILHIRGTDSVYSLDRFNVWVNDVPVFGMRGISIKHRKSNSFDTTVTITLSQGENRIETSIKNVNGTESYRIPLLVKFTPAVPKKEMAYFIGIGINNFADSSHPLQYSVKDIRNLADSLNKGGYIVIDTLFDKNVSVRNIKALKKRLLQTTENDKVIIAYSGHGLLSKDYDYYLSTYNVNFSQPDSGGLPYDDLENLLDSIPARKKLMLIDACHSGEVDKEELSRIAQVQKQLDSPKKEADRTGRKDGIDEVIVIADTANRRLGINNSFELMQSLFVNVGKSTGATIIAAAGGTQFAWEGDKWNNSVFTFSILEAMTLHPSLKVNELKRLVGQRVYELTEGLQKPISRNETNNFDWKIWQH